MLFYRFQKPMFTAAIKADRNEILPLIDFLHFLYAEEIAAKLIEHPLGPSKVWEAWAAETYLGVSTHGLMLRSGHRFTGAALDEPPSRLPWKRDKFHPAQQERNFVRCYPAYRVPGEHRDLLATHPGAYWRVAEAVILSGDLRASRMLEIGAGNAVHVAFRHLLNAKMRTTIIDLPESMFAGYILLRSMGIEVALPHEEREAQVVMRLPTQGLTGLFDFAFNMSSFQEMRLETVNRYIALMRDHLLPGGRLQHVNLEQSRQIVDNRPAIYDLSGLENPVFSPTPYHSSLAAGLIVASVLAERP